MTKTGRRREGIQSRITKGVYSQTSTLKEGPCYELVPRKENISYIFINLIENL